MRIEIRNDFFIQAYVLDTLMPAYVPVAEP